MITNALTVDVEEYYHAAIFRRATRKPASLESRVERSVDQLLALMNEREDPRRAFQQQSLLLRESFSEED